MNERKKKAPFLFFFILPAVLLTGCEKSPYKAHSDVFAMDTVFSVSLYHQNASSQDKQLSELTELLNILSDELDCHKETSAVSILNETGSYDDTSGTLSEIFSATSDFQERFGTAVSLSCRPLTRLWELAAEENALPSEQALLEACKTIDDKRIRLSGQTITLPSETELDFGAVAKGYALDRIASYFELQNTSEQPQYAVVSAASAVLLYGKKPEDHPFTVQISDPNSENILGTLTIKPNPDRAPIFLSTSGNAERYMTIDGQSYGHIYNLSTGYPVDTELASVTVITDCGLKADFLSTLIFAEGLDRLSTHLSAPDYAVLAVDSAGNRYQSDGLSFEVFS